MHTGAPVVVSAQSHPASVCVMTSDCAKRLERQADVILGSDTPGSDIAIGVSADQRFQTIAGFGAWLTESSAWLMSTAQARRVASGT